MILFALYPLIEFVSLILLSQKVGFGYTILYVFLSFIVGFQLIASAGPSSLSFRDSPQDLLEAPFRVVSGVLLMIPGLVSDVIALLVLIPFVRRVLWFFLVTKIFRGQFKRKVWTHYRSNYGSGSAKPFDQGPIENTNFTGVNDVANFNNSPVERDVTPKDLSLEGKLESPDQGKPRIDQ